MEENLTVNQIHDMIDMSKNQAYGKLMSRSGNNCIQAFDPNLRWEELIEGNLKAARVRGKPTYQMESWQSSHQRGSDHDAYSIPFAGVSVGNIYKDECASNNLNNLRKNPQNTHEIENKPQKVTTFNISKASDSKEDIRVVRL